jgi:multiple antibiotic resistance protein
MFQAGEFWLCFVPLFVAVDPIGVLPTFMALTARIEPDRVRLIVVESVLTAAAVSLLFLAGGPAAMGLMGITAGDFTIAGGLVLFALSLTDLLAQEKRPVSAGPGSFGAVPLGVPLIAGPAVFTTSIILHSEYGFAATALALVANILVAGTFFWVSGRVVKVLGRPGAAIVSKLASLLLAAIAVMMIRKGISSVLGGG